jgi:hypothetical protein
MTEKQKPQLDPVVHNLANRWAYSYVATTALLVAILAGGLVTVIAAAVLSAIVVPLFVLAPIPGLVVGRKVFVRVYDGMVGE